MTENGIRRNGPRLVMGLIVLAVGVLFTLDKLGYVNAGDFWQYWPLFLIAVGIGRIIQPRPAHGRGFGVVLLVIGVWLLLSNLDVIDYRLWDFWPVFLVLLGVAIVWRAVTGSPWDGVRQRIREATAESVRAGTAAAAEPSSATARSVEGRPDDAASVNGFALLGAIKRKCVSQEFRGGELTAIMGGCELDLRGAAIGGGQAVIDTFAFWGGIEIKVPEDWSVVVRGTPVLGSFDDKTVHAGGSGKVLVIKGTALMGGVEVKN